MVATRLLISFLKLGFAKSCYDPYSYPVLVGDKDAELTTSTYGLCTAISGGNLFFSFYSNDKTLRAEEQDSEFTYLGYMVFENFSTPATFAVAYKKIAYIDKEPKGYLCTGDSANFYLATNDGEIVKVTETQATYYTILDTFHDPVTNFEINQVSIEEGEMFLVAEYSNPSLTFVVCYISLTSSDSQFTVLDPTTGFSINSVSIDHDYGKTFTMRVYGTNSSGNFYMNFKHIITDTSTEGSYSRYATSAFVDPDAEIMLIYNSSAYRLYLLQEPAFDKFYVTF